jgi:hypothetical protein
MGSVAKSPQQIRHIVNNTLTVSVNKNKRKRITGLQFFIYLTNYHAKVMTTMLN